MQKLYVGARAPQAIQVTVTRATSSFDLSTVTSALFLGEKPSGTAISWSAALSLASATSVTLTYELDADGSDIDETGTYRFYPKLTAPSGTIDCEALTLVVEDPLA